MKRGRSRTLSLCHLVILPLLLLGTTVSAQAPTDPQLSKVFTNKAQFRLPLKLSDADRLEIQEVRLYVKSSSEGWTLKESAPPGQTYFTYAAPRDDEYWFTVVTVDKTGKATPSDV